MQRKYLSPVEVKKLLDFLKRQSIEPDEAFSMRKSTYQKLYAFIATMAYTGMRTRECRFLQLRDCTFGLKPSLFIRHSKNGDSRTCPMPNKLKAILRPYIKSLGFKDPESYIFTAKNTGKPFTHQLIDRQFKLACVRSGIGENSLHSLRHSFGFLAFDKTKNLRLVQDLLGHRSISSTVIYTQLNPESVREAVNAIF